MQSSDFLPPPTAQGLFDRAKVPPSLGDEQIDDDSPHPHRNAPQPDPICLYGLVGDVARAGSEGTETNAHAIAANFMAYLSCAIGRGVYLPIGNTRHHTRLFCLHIGRSGRGRKGDAVSLVLRIDATLQAIDDAFAPQVHRGGLSTREGLAAAGRSSPTAAARRPGSMRLPMP